MKKGSLNRKNRKLDSQPTNDRKTAQSILKTFENRKIIQNRKNAEDE